MNQKHEETQINIHKQPRETEDTAIYIIEENTQRRSRRAWTPEEDELLKELYPKGDMELIRNCIPHPIGSVKNHARFLGLCNENSPIRHWSAEEDDILRIYYPIEGKAVFKRLPDRTAAAVAKRILKLNLGHSNFVWTKEADELLKELYPEGDWGLLEEKFPCSRIAIRHHASELGISPCNARSYRHWTKEEDAIIRAYYPTEGKHAAKRLPGRTTVAAVGRANVLKIPRQENLNWSEKEDELLRKLYPERDWDTLLKTFHRSKSAIITRAAVLKITEPGTWSDEEINILKTYYPIEAYKAFKRIPGRSKNACALMANHLGLVARDRHWSEEEITILKTYYPTEKSKVINRLPGRNLIAIQKHASRLGLTNRAENNN